MPASLVPSPPRRAPKPPKRKRRWLRRTLWTLFTLGLIGAAGLVIAYAMTPIPKPNEKALQRSSTIYYSDGKTVMDRFANVNRQIVGLDKGAQGRQRSISGGRGPQLLPEQRHLAQGHRPLDLGRPQGRPATNGSTITQRYVKNYYLTQDPRSPQGARDPHLDQDRPAGLQGPNPGRLPQHHLLRPRGLGHQTASLAYFGKSVQNLDVAQGALLASVIRGPSCYDPRLGMSSSPTPNRGGPT